MDFTYKLKYSNVCFPLFFRVLVAFQIYQLTGEIEAMKAACEAGGVEGCMRYVESKRDEWKDVPLNVAVIGNSGVGKSSYVNAVRSLTADDEGSAPVGVIETTKEPRSYQHPNNPMLKFWDLPGVGTKEFPRSTYLSKIEVDRYDFFQLITADRFTENDTWLGIEFRKRNKKFFFVRTKIGLDISNNQQAHPETHNEEAVIDNIRQSTEAELSENGFEDVPVFLIDNYQLDKFDFENLKKQLIADLPDLKRTSLIFSLHSTSEQMIKLKVKELRSRIWRSAALSATAAAFQIPRLSFAVDRIIITGQAAFYFKQLGLDPESLKRTAKLYSVDYEEMQSIVSKELSNRGVDAATIESMTSTVMSMINHCLPLAAKAAAQESERVYLPLIRSLIAAPLLFGGTYWALNFVLDKFEEVAVAVIKSVGLPLVDGIAAGVPDGDSVLNSGPFQVLGVAFLSLAVAAFYLRRAE